MIKAVIFDLDHTLFDRHGTLREVAKYFRKEFEVSPSITDEEIAEKWIYADDHFVYDGWEYIFAYLVENGVFAVPPEYCDYRSFVYKYFAQIAVSFEETIPMLKNLRNQGYKTGLITNGGHSLQYKKLEMLNLTKYFDEIIVSGDVMIDKPDKEIFLIMSDKLSIAPEDMIYVGDNPKNDIKGARSAGYKTIWMKSTGLWQYGLDPADEEADRVEEIPALVEKISKNN